MPEMVMARPGAMIPRGIMTRMTNIPIQVYGINLLVRLLAEGPADVRVHCPKGSPIRYGEVVARGDGFDEGANAFREMPGIKTVVAEGDPAAWTHPPFAADVTDGRIWGRGAADMKGGLAAAMIAAAAIKRSGARFQGALVVGALVDEEGDMIGARHLCGTPLGRALTAAVICEPEQNELCLEQRGVVWARVTVRGRMAHGAMPEAGANPIAALGTVLSQAPRLERRLRRLCRPNPYPRPPTVPPTTVLSPLAGVARANVIPAAAAATLDLRLTSGPDETAIAAEIDRFCREASARTEGVTVDWRPVNI